MANMSYCRFQNTLSDLEDCANALADFDASSNLGDGFVDGDGDTLSESEMDALKSMVDVASKFVTHAKSLQERYFF